jgi:hypothetical protein
LNIFSYNYKRKIAESLSQQDGKYGVTLENML